MSNEWLSVTTLPPLAGDELQVWRIHLADATYPREIYEKCLSSIEVDRAKRLRIDQVRLQFVVARGALRVLLGNLLSLPPNLVPITLGRYGKPETAPVDGLSLFFNVAHSRQTILIALCRCSPVGVDVEYFDRETEALEIARNSFTKKEFAQLAATKDPAERQRLFFRCWTRKEAVIKADGRGLSLPLNLVEVPTEEVARAASVVIQEDSGDGPGSQTWFLTDINLGEGIAAAVTLGRPHLAPCTYEFPLALLCGD